MEETVFGVASMYRHAADFVRSLRPEKKAVVVAMEGDLGAGKTTFVQGALKALGVNEHTTSPTFVIQKIYHLYGKQFSQAIHIDAYRLTDAHELEALGWQETLANPGNLIFIEWPERVADAVPKDAIELHLRFIDENTRGVERIGEA